MQNLRRTDPPETAPRQRMTWDEICTDAGLRGRWVAIDDCSFDASTGCATSGLVVDCDDDLAELCSRMRDSAWRNCSIVFAGENDGSRRTRLN